MARIARTTDPQAELVATAINYRRIDPTWIDNATDEEGYRIERHEAQTADSLFTQVPSNTTEYADNTPSLLPNRQYCYRVVAYDQEGESYSNEACATTDPLPEVACTAIRRCEFDTDALTVVPSGALTAAHSRVRVGAERHLPSPAVMALGTLATPFASTA
jgi:hypothetical protein